jgi:endonuclease YncB( thermonuclease family)
MPGFCFAGQYKVTKVYDGNTIKVVGQGKTIRVRLVGIDAPEQGQPYYTQSKKHLSDLVLNRFITLRDLGAGPYKRLLGEVFLGGMNINLEMLEAGLTEVYRGVIPKNLDLYPYLEAEQRARDTETGVWSLGKRYISPGLWRKARKRMRRLKYGAEQSYGPSDPETQNLP